MQKWNHAKTEIAKTEFLQNYKTLFSLTGCADTEASLDVTT